MTRSTTFDPAISRSTRSSSALLHQLSALCGGAGTMIQHIERPWASITFSGSKHEITWGFAGEEAMERGETLIANLPEHEFSIPGQLVADAAVDWVDHRSWPSPSLLVRFTILMLEEA